MKIYGLLCIFFLGTCTAHDSNTNKIGNSIQLEMKAQEDSFNDLKFYYGDNHFHSGFSGDNEDDSEPLVAFENAFERAMNWGSNAEYGGDPTKDLGGYFLVVSDHLKFVPTRKDMTNELFQEMLSQADSVNHTITKKSYTFTALAGGEITGLRRGSSFKPWDDKFGHINVFNLKNVEPITENNLFFNTSGNNMMDILSKNPNVVAQINHPGYGGEPVLGNSDKDIFPFTVERDRVFNLIEVTDGRTENWEIGIAQYHKALRKGFHLSPVVGSDIHNTKDALFMRSHSARDKVARTVILAPQTTGLSVNERRGILVQAIKKGRVYATEDSNIQIKWSINDVLMGGELSNVLPTYKVKIEVNDPGMPAKKFRNYDDSSLLESITLIKGYFTTKEEAKSLNEQDYVNDIKRWSFDEDTPRASIYFELNGKLLEDARYLMLSVQQRDDDRAITTPIYFK